MLIGDTTNVSFRVNVMGTSIEPKVRVLLSTSPELSFPASKSGEEWKVSMNIPPSIEPGKYDLRVEVMLNNRHFTPLTKSIELVGKDAVPAAGWPVAQEVEAVQPEIAPVEMAYEAAPVIEPVVEEPAVQKITLPADKIAAIFKVENPPAPSAPTKIAYKPIIPRDITEDKKAPITKKVKATKKTKMLEIKHELPVSLVKGEIVYE